MTDVSEWILIYLALGALVGWLGGLFGIGGGLILVPVLLFSFEAQHFSGPHLLHLALGTSMATILFTSLASMRQHHRHGAVNWPVVRTITPGILLGTALGTLLAAGTAPHFLALFFALFVYFAAGQILLGKRPHPARPLPGRMGMTAFGTLTGTLSSLVSIGGGTLIVPFLVWCNITLRHAIGTSAAISFPVALGATTGYIATGWLNTDLPAPHLGYVYLPALLWIALASIVTAPLGAKAAHRMKVELLRKLFAVMLMVLATRMLFNIIA
ncbi:MAG: sulfite exporter TauE/SafE family protein [Gallionella sp.]|nr:sulfite exporter TauE/SafE family protein [Gallionella sp.]